jgi:hypothetical protein
MANGTRLASASASLWLVSLVLSIVLGSMWYLVPASLFLLITLMVVK